MTVNVETVHALYAAFGRGDIAAIPPLLAADVAWEHWDDNAAQRAGVPWLLPRTGRDEVVGFFELLGDALEFSRFEPTAFLTGDRQVAVTVSVEATIKSIGEEVRDDEVHLFTFNDFGEIASLRHYLDTAKHIRLALTAQKAMTS
jgi:ketosteroid isomerase-like protein